MGKGLLLIKRPGLNNLLKKLVEKYEVVIFADDSTIFVDSCREVLDPHN
jgi:TFIIF-interacting CTD phosphatase-like protein